MIQVHGAVEDDACLEKFHNNERGHGAGRERDHKNEFVFCVDEVEEVSFGVR